MKELMVLGIFGAFCLVIGYCVGSAKAQWLHWRTGRILKDMERTKRSLESLRQDIYCILKENDMLKDGE